MGIPRTGHRIDCKIFQSEGFCDCGFNTLPSEHLNRLRGQLQNCVNHLEGAKRHSCGKRQEKYAQAIESANKALYETLIN